jgi:hypothetical protein
LRDRYDRSEDLIADLAADAVPVRRLRPPLWRTISLVGAAGAIVALSVVWHGLRPDLAEKFNEPLNVLEWLASLATALGAFLAAFHLSLPDRSPRWLAAALIPAALWLSVIGAGCLADFSAHGMHAFTWGTSLPCFRYITEMGIPLTLVVLVMIRHAAPIRPIRATVCAGLGAAALSATGLTLFHDLEASWLVLIWHGSALLTVLGVAALGGLLMRRLARVRSPLF